VLSIDVVIPRLRPRRWQTLIVERLRQSGHRVAVTGIAVAEPWSRLTDRLLDLERRIRGNHKNALASLAEPPQDTSASGDVHALRLDLTAAVAEFPLPTFSLVFDDSASPAAALRSLSLDRLPQLGILLDGHAVVAEASPMVDNRFLASAALEDVLARAVTLVVSAVGRFEAGTLPQGTLHAAATSSCPALLAFHPILALPRLARELIRRTRFRFAHWRVGYRLIDGPGVAETGYLGAGWAVLQDDGTRFFADPFPVEWQGRHFIFVEDFSHAAGKAVISFIEIGADGRASPPRKVIEEPHHLSYPQVFARDGQMWMLPEGSGGRELTLYRAESFPDRWVRHAVLFTGRELSDATLVEYTDRLWLFATERDGHGSTSDTLVVFHATRLDGPWTAHPMNPITIDRAAARPGGAAVQVGNKLLLPLQDGTLGYGSGLGLAEITELTKTAVRLARPVPIGDTGDFPYPKIHTLNRAGRLEVIDGIAVVPK
jgi:hypothetical protein